MKAFAGIVSGIRHSSLIGMLPVVNGDEINNLPRLIRKENQPVAFRDSCGLFTVQGTGKPPACVKWVFPKSLKLFTQFCQSLFVTPDVGEPL